MNKITTTKGYLVEGQYIPKDSTLVLNNDQPLEEAFASGSAFTVVEKMLSVLSKRVGAKIIPGEVALNYSNDFGNFSGFYGFFGNEAIRINFSLGKSDRIVSADYYKRISDVPDFTITFDHNDNIVQIVSAIEDVIVNGVTENPLNESLEERKPMADEAVYSWILSDRRTNEQVIQNSRLSNVFKYDYQEWAKLNQQPSLSLASFMKSVKKYLEENRMNNRYLYGARIDKGSGKEQQITTKDDEKSWLASMEMTVNEKFVQLESFIDLLLKGMTASVVVSGRAGIGKSHTVFKALNERNVKYAMATGVMKTPLDLYQALWRHRGEQEVIVFDDFDVLNKKGFTDLLKGALDLDSRVVSFLDKNFVSPSAWKAMTPKQQEKNVPNTFKFLGKAIFITNMPFAKLTSAIIDRSLAVDLNLSSGETLARIKSKISEFPPDCKAEFKVKAFEWLLSNANTIQNISFRMFEKVTVFASSGVDESTWGKWAFNALSVTGKVGV